MGEKTQEILALVEERQNAGYIAWNRHQRAKALDAWLEAWRQVTALMADGRFATLEELDRSFHGSQAIALWVQDLSDALYQAGLERPVDLAASQAFNRQVLNWTGQPEGMNGNRLRRMIADAAFRLEGSTAGDAAYESFLEANPTWGWGWAAWADQYSFDRRAPWHDLSRAEQILRKALKVDNLNDRMVVLERLRDLLLRQGRPTAASAVEITPGRQPVWRRWFPGRMNRR